MREADRAKVLRSARLLALQSGTDPDLDLGIAAVPYRTVLYAGAATLLTPRSYASTAAKICRTEARQSYANDTTNHTFSGDRAQNNLIPL